MTSRAPSGDDLNTQLAARSLHRFQICAAIASYAEFESVPRNRLLDGIRVSDELVADRRPDEVGAIGIEALVHQQIDMAKVDESDIDCDFLSLALFVSQPMYFSGHRPSSQTIYMDGIWMAHRTIAIEEFEKSKRDRKRVLEPALHCRV